MSGLRAAGARTGRRTSGRRTAALLAVVCGWLITGPAARAYINVELRPVQQEANLGSQVRVGLYVVSDSGTNQLMSAADIIIGWAPAYLRLLGNDNTGAVSLLVSAFPSVDPYHINESSPPQDGDALYLAYAYGGQPVAATPQGTLLTTVVFEALAATEGTTVSILEQAGSPVGHTIVYDGTVPGLDVTGTLGSAVVSIRVCGDSDADADGDVDLADFAAFQRCFSGPGVAAEEDCACTFDSEPDADVDLADLPALVNALTGPL